MLLPPFRPAQIPSHAIPDHGCRFSRSMSGLCFGVGVVWGLGLCGMGFGVGVGIGVGVLSVYFCLL